MDDLGIEVALLLAMIPVMAAMLFFGFLESWWTGRWYERMEVIGND